MQHRELLRVIIVSSQHTKVRGKVMKKAWVALPKTLMSSNVF